LFQGVERGRKVNLPNDGLAELDVKLSNAYRASLQQLPPAGQQQLTRDQFHWLQRRNACEDYGCVERAYRNRLSALEGYYSPE
jgi:uncharacterized protein